MIINEINAYLREYRHYTDDELFQFVNIKIGHYYYSRERDELLDVFARDVIRLLDLRPDLRRRLYQHYNVRLNRSYFIRKGVAL